MSEGNSKVEKYMPMVAKAIQRNVQSEPSRTDIYNRAYEAVWQAIDDQEEEIQNFRGFLSSFYDDLKNGNYGGGIWAARMQSKIENLLKLPKV